MITQHLSFLIRFDLKRPQGLKQGLKFLANSDPLDVGPTVKVHVRLPTRVVLPALTRFYFQGDSKYLEDVISRIDVPLLRHIVIFDTPLLLHFISRTENFTTPQSADIQCGD